MADWTYTAGHGLGERRGLYVLRRDEIEVGTVALLEEVGHHNLRMERIASLMADVDELVASGARRERGETGDE